MRPAPVFAVLLPVTACLGTVHAYSVFLDPLEARFVLARAQSSLGYSAALVCLTLAVLLGPSLHARLRPGTLLALAAWLAAGGALLAGLAPGFGWFLAGYGVLFGLGNGLGYGFALFFAAAALPQARGLAIGAVTAAYGLGAALAPALFTVLLAAHGIAGALGGLAALLAVLGLIAWAVLPDLPQSPRGQSGGRLPPGRHLALLWLAYGTAVLAGLMAIGHATAIARAAGMVQALWLAPIALAAANTAASLLGGLAADRLRPQTLLAGIAAASGLALLWLAGGAGSAVLIALAIVGACYGATIAVWPVLIAGAYAARGPRVYGRVFTAWGAAGLAGPVLAGALYDRTGGYTPALLTAAALAGVSALLIRRLGG